MRISVLAKKDLLEEDYDVSDGDSVRIEFPVNHVNISLLSKDPVEFLIELEYERDKTIVSIICSEEEFRALYFTMLSDKHCVRGRL